MPNLKRRSNNWAKSSPMSANKNKTPAWATAVWVVLPPASSTRSPPCVFPPWATASAINTVCSNKKSWTVSKLKNPICGSTKIWHGRSAVRTNNMPSASADKSSIWVIKKNGIRAKRFPRWHTMKSSPATAATSPTRCACGRHTPVTASIWQTSTAAITLPPSARKTATKTSRASSIRTIPPTAAANCA